MKFSHASDDSECPWIPTKGFGCDQPDHYVEGHKDDPEWSQDLITTILVFDNALSVALANLAREKAAH